MQANQAEPLDTCQRCGLNVRRSSTTFSSTGDLLCRSCGDGAAYQQSVARAHASANESMGGGVIGLARKVQQSVEVDRAGGLSQLGPVDAGFMQAARKAEADTFTCQCGRALPVAQGAFSRAGRALCPPCLAQDTSRAPGDADNSGKIIGILFGVGVGAAIVCWRLGLIG